MQFYISGSSDGILSEYYCLYCTKSSLYLGTIRKEGRIRRTSNQENVELILEMVQGDSTYKKTDFNNNDNDNDNYNDNNNDNDNDFLDKA